MAGGKYAYPPVRRKRRKRSPLGPIIVILLLITALSIFGTVLLRSCEKEEASAPETQPAVTEPQTPVTEPEPEVTTVPPTEAPTEEPTEEPTEAPTEEPTEEPAEEPTDAPTEAPTLAPDEQKALGQQMADIAIAQVGKPYELGGVGPDAFDTSGFVIYCYKEVTGNSLPHLTTEQAGKGERIEKEDLLPGDVVFFWTENPEAVEYQGIYIGNGKFVAARNPEKPVSEMDMNIEYFAQRYLFACRYW